MKAIVAFDVETTGLSPKTDFILQLSMVKLDPVTLAEEASRSWYVRPYKDFTISPQAQEKHGLSKEFIQANGVYLRDIAEEILEFMNGCDLLTYNGNTFDINFLYSNLHDVGYEFDLTGRKFYDAFLMYKALHPSNLEAVYKRYTGKDLVGAHDALNDVRATVDIFAAMHEQENITREDIDNMEVNEMISPERSIRRGFGNDICFATGKYKDVEFMKVAYEDPSYLRWFMDNVATEYTKKVLREYYKERRATK